MSSFIKAVDNYFGISSSTSSYKQELRAGITTFVTMAYILFVNPQILGNAIQLPGANGFAQLLTATALAAGIGSILMGILARYPFALAPGMGLNAYFAFSVVIGQKIEWQVALGAVFISGTIFCILSVVRIREMIINAIPKDLKVATAAGIGLFLAILGLKNAGIVVDNPATLVGLGSMTSAPAAIALFGLLITAILLVRNIRGAILIGIILSTILAIATGAAVFQGKAFGGFTGGFIQAPAWPSDLFFSFDLVAAINFGVLGIVFTFLFVDLFDTAGTLMGLADTAGYLDKQGRLPRASHAFFSDAVATMFGSILGTSTTTTYIESAAGINDGGRTGITSIVVGLLFLLSIFFWPLIGAVPAAATAPALILVGALMMMGVGKIEWKNYSVAIPSFLTLIGMPLTFSIANGVSFGIVSYVAIKLLSGKPKEVNWLMYILAALLIIRFIYIAE